MIVSINQLDRLLIEVDPNTPPESIREMVEVEISGAVVEQIAVVDKFKRPLVLGQNIGVVYDRKDGPFVSDKKLFLVTYFKDMAKAFKDSLKKIEKARKEKEAAEADRIANKEKESKAKEIADLQARLKALGVDAPDTAQEKQDRIDKALEG